MKLYLVHYLSVKIKIRLSNWSLMFAGFIKQGFRTQVEAGKTKWQSTSDITIK